MDMVRRWLALPTRPGKFLWYPMRGVNSSDSLGLEENIPTSWINRVCIRSLTPGYGNFVIGQNGKWRVFLHSLRGELWDRKFGLSVRSFAASFFFYCPTPKSCSFGKKPGVMMHVTVVFSCESFDLQSMYSFFYYFHSHVFLLVSPPGP